MKTINTNSVLRTTPGLLVSKAFPKLGEGEKLMIGIEIKPSAENF